jgi:hypothetical protein
VPLFRSGEVEVHIQRAKWHSQRHPKRQNVCYPFWGHYSQVHFSRNFNTADSPVMSIQYLVICTANYYSCAASLGLVPSGDPHTMSSSPTTFRLRLRQTEYALSFSSHTVCTHARADTDRVVFWRRHEPCAALRPASYKKCQSSLCQHLCQTDRLGARVVC